MNSLIIDGFRKELNDLDIPEEDKQEFYKLLEGVLGKKLNILIIGPTGVGKSTTVNALFHTEIAKVGSSPDPQTKDIQAFDLFPCLTLWDSPGFGDTPEQDQKYFDQIVSLLQRKDKNGNGLIDLVLVVVDASQKDLGTVYELIGAIKKSQVVENERIIVALNQCDMAQKSRGWNHNEGKPEAELMVFLNKKALSIKKRISNTLDIFVDPMYYSALHKYNITKLLYFIVEHTPAEKRLLFPEIVNPAPEIWEHNDEVIDYGQAVKRNIVESFENAIRGARQGAAIRANIGSIIPIMGSTIGAVVGGLIGFIGGLFS